MSSFNSAPGASGPANGGSGDTDPSNRNFESLLAQLRRQSGPHSPAPEPTGSHGYHQHGRGHGHDESYYSTSAVDSPRLDNNYGSAADSPGFLPAAPTPPVQGLSSFPPSLMNALGGAARGAPGDDRTAHLLNLLKFSGQSNDLPTSVPAPREPPTNLIQPQLAQTLIHAPAPASADPTGLLAALMKGTSQHEQPTKPEPPAPVSTWNAGEPPSDTQQYLLNLLNRPKPSQHNTPAVDASSHRGALTPQSTQEPARSPSGNAVGGTSAEDTPSKLPTRASFDFEPGNVESPPPKFGSSPQVQPSTAAPKASIFSYTNPFEDLAASSPRHRTPKSSAASQAAGLAPATAQPVQVVRNPDEAHSISDQKRSSNGRSPLQSPEHTRRKIEQTASPLANGVSEYLAQPSASSPSPREGDKAAHPTVSEAVSALAGKADVAAQEALARAEEEEQTQIKIVEDLNTMASARSEEEFDQSAQQAAQAIQKELEKEANQTVLEDTLPAELAKEVREIVDDAAAGGSHAPVADSWESAEADEIIVVEEESTPVQVFNLPMKPWIAINVQDGANENRPQFREEALLDIARLKKEFDQIDRNLVAASENYLAYGMSKHGGLRVIRQVDGLDVKLFTDTHDRIFNVAVSSTPADQNVTPKEAIIGTGVSGAVYWIQLKTGEKEHLDDAHPEQYGFALPPISTHDGDAPGGVLKTRARTSAAHPEYFAVGRGKSINIIWPSFVMAKKLFKPGHDRVVDTEKLFKQCSLKINTGKAGKDFTFSQDDTTVVSLDKSGRVKFWDVRDLTAAAEDSDPRNPMPARTSLEIKEPLTTLTSTPEGEKAWPTSVLLLDKLRPYQKKTALRYMIVGMKQNHTLQLWDLALGKPVQEINLPHSKESDAVCSVMYHPSTGMIVVGHPTRNSVYLLHLSAPKYAIKNLSQVEYIQRLVAQDSSIPQPNSTAVISGIREYSFANKGVLRSLDILANPATSLEGEEQTLFELYAMHSKGVTCLFIKQAELGWTQDNKVIRPVDALATGVVKIVKLVSPPSPLPGETHAAAPAEPNLPIRLANRNTAKDSLQKTTSAQGEEKKAVESASAAKSVPERKEDDTPAQPPPERTEKKARKKKANANAAAPVAEREFLVPVNGAQGRSSSPQARAVKGSPRTVEAAHAAPVGTSAAEMGEILSTVGESIAASLRDRLRAALAGLADQLNDQQVAREQTFQDKQMDLLRKVSDVLNENTQVVLKKIVQDQFEQAIVPTVRDTVGKAVADQLGSRFNKDIGQSVQRELQKALPGAVSQALAKPETAKSISDKVVQSLGTHIDEQLLSTLNSHLIPAFSTVAGQAVQRLGEDIYRRVSGDVARLEQRHQDDTAKIDQLLAQTTHLSNMISTMAASQSQIQKEFLAMKQQMRERDAPSAGPASGPASSHAGSVVSPNAPAHMTPHGQAAGSVGHGPGHSLGNARPRPREMGGGYSQQQLTYQEQQPGQSVFSPTGREQVQLQQRDPDIEIVDELMANGSYDEAMMRFLQAQDKEEDIFSQVIVKYDPNFVTQLQPLLLLSVGATVSAKLDSRRNVAEKLALTEMVIYRFNQMLPSLDDQLREVTPKIMGLIKGRVEQLFIRVSRLSPSDPSLKMLTNMANVAGRIAETVQRGGSGQSRDRLY